MQARFIRIILSTTMLSLSAIPAAYAADDKDPYADKLLGDWGGLRERLANSGVEAGLDYTGSLWSVRSGGLKEGETYSDIWDLNVAFDNEKLLGIEGNKAMLQIIGNAGGDVNNRVGSVQGIDNLEAAPNTIKIMEAYIEQSLAKNRVSVLVGLHDINTEFNVTDMSANFIVPTMQLAQTWAQSGQNGISAFPVTSFGGRIKFLPSENSYMMVTAVDGVPGNPDRPHGTHVDFEDGDGILWAAEVGYTPNLEAQGDTVNNKVAIGAWSYSERFDDLRDVDSFGNPIKRRQQGAYLVSSYQFYKDKASEKDLGAFFRAGFSDGDTAQTEFDYNIGFVGHGWIAGRADGELGIGVSQASNGNKYNSVTPGAEEHERIYEIYYMDQVARGITLQPDLQYVTNPGTDPTVDNAKIVGLRVGISF